MEDAPKYCSVNTCKSVHTRPLLGGLRQKFNSCLKFSRNCSGKLSWSTRPPVAPLKSRETHYSTASTAVLLKTSDILSEGSLLQSGTPKGENPTPPAGLEGDPEGAPRLGPWAREPRSSLGPSAPRRAQPRVRTHLGHQPPLPSPELAGLAGRGIPPSSAPAAPGSLRAGAGEGERGREGAQGGVEGACDGGRDPGTR